MNLLEETASGIMSIDEDFEGGETVFEIINIEYEERKWSQILRNEVKLGDLSVITNAPGLIHIKLLPSIKSMHWI